MASQPALRLVRNGKPRVHRCAFCIFHTYLGNAKVPFAAVGACRKVNKVFVSKNCFKPDSVPGHYCFKHLREIPSSDIIHWSPNSKNRVTLKIAAVAAECDFEGFGLHSLRHGNITWRQEVCASASEQVRFLGLIGNGPRHLIVDAGMLGEICQPLLKRQRGRGDGNRYGADRSNE